METIVLAILAVLGIIVLLYLRSKRSKERDEGLHTTRIGDKLRRLNANKERYATMTRALLDGTADDELLEAVLSGLWAKMDDDLSDAPAVMQGLSKERQYIYALYAITGAVGQDGFQAAKAGPEAAFLPIAAQALEVLDMQQSEALLQEAMRADDAEPFSAPYIETFHGENGKPRMVAYIREHVPAFLDIT